MIRAVIFLLIAVAVVALVMSLVRRARRPREYQAYPTAAEAAASAPPQALPASVAEDTGPVLSVDDVLHRLNELAFARTLTTSAGGHDEIIAAVTVALETAANEPK